MVLSNRRLVIIVIVCAVFMGAVTVGSLMFAFSYLPDALKSDVQQGHTEQFWKDLTEDDVDHPITLSASGFTCLYPRNWVHSEKTVYPGNNRHYPAQMEYLLQPLCSSYIRIFEVPKAYDPHHEKSVDLIIGRLRSTLTDKKETPINKWGKVEVAGKRLTGTIITQPIDLRCFYVLHAAARNHDLLIIDYRTARDMKIHQAGFDLVANSFALTAQAPLRGLSPAGTVGERRF